MELYVIRHGQTDYNKRGIIQGRSVDSSLNEHGRIQAKLFVAEYGHIPFDYVFTSSQKRSQESVQHFIDRGDRHLVYSQLDEISWGKSEGIPTSKESYEAYMHCRKAWEEGDYTARLDGGESLEELSHRVEEFVEEMEAMTFERALICSHGRTLRVLFAHLFREELSRLQQYDHGNFHLFHLQWKGYKWEALRQNDRSHLSLS